MKQLCTTLSILALCILSTCLSANGQGTAFTYQGRLVDGAVPATGSYDMTFSLFDAASSGAQVGSTLTKTATGVTNGLFVVTLDFGAQFNGANRWLEIAVRTNGGASYTTLASRQPLTPSPYAIYSGTASTITGSVSLSQLPAAVVTNGAVGLTLAGTFTGNGAGVSNVNATTVGGLNSAAFWQLAGNNVSAGQFLGSTNNQPLELKANAARALRLEPNTNGAPNVIGGSPFNVAASGVVGATIGGGGATNYSTGTSVGSLLTNSVSANFGTIEGGAANAVQSGSIFSVIGGGFNNIISNNVFNAIIGGGNQNVIETGGTANVIAGGDQNAIRAQSGFSVIGGGGVNEIQANSVESVIAGGEVNSIMTNCDHSAIGGGGGNAIRQNSMHSTIAGGFGNGIGPAGTNSSVGGGDHNIITNANFATISGGNSNRIGTATLPNVSYSFNNNQATTIGGGGGNSIGILCAGATIGGGIDNSIIFSAQGSTIGGGDYNSISNSSTLCTIAGGYGNSITSIVNFGTIAGGYNNTVTGNYGAVPGGDLNAAAESCFAVGHRAKANHVGSFVWSDAQGTDFSTTGPNQFLIRSLNGVGINTNNPTGYSLAINGAVGITGFNSLEFGVGVTPKEVNAGKIGYRTFSSDSLDIVGAGTNTSNRIIRFYCEGGAFFTGVISAPSDRNIKQDFAKVDAKTVLEKVAALPIQSWAYTNDATRRHIGPVAQDFHQAFGLNGADDKTIATVDADGVALAAIQGLNEKLSTELKKRDAENAALKARLEKLEHLLESRVALK